jgi:hypothetical protein
MARAIIDHAEIARDIDHVELRSCHPHSGRR